MDQKLLEQKLAQAEKRVAVLEKMIEDKSRELYQVNEGLRKSEAWLATTLKSIGDGVIATDTKGFVTYMNPVAQGLTGWKEEDARGKSFEEVFVIVNEETEQKVVDPVSRVLEEGRIVGLGNHTILISKDGARYVIDDSAAPLWDDKGKIIGVVLIFRDATERRRTSRELEVKLNELQRFNKLAVGRELKMRELKNKIKELEARLTKGGG
ncbi:PAS domain S-box protein [Candidatus Margulisiibacteriota bacterium]